MEHFLSSWGYVALFVLTVAEAACVPIPSEVTVGFGGALASGPFGHHHLDLGAVIAIATVGEVCGAYIGYAIGRYGGRPLVDRFGKYVLLSHHDLDRAERWFDGKGEWSVLVGRVLPLVRTFIAPAAGLAGMQKLRYGIFTGLGSLVWVSALAIAGYQLGGQWTKLEHGFGPAGYALGVSAVAAIGAFIVLRWRAARVE